MTLYPKLILDALATVRYPGTGKNLVEAEMVADNMRIEGMKVSFSLTFEKPTDPFMKSMVKAAETAVHTYVSPEVEVVITTESRQAARPEVGKLLPQVKNVIGVSSGKGGVASPRLLPTLPCLWQSWVIRWVCWMLISSDLPFLRCSKWKMPVRWRRTLVDVI